MEVLSTPRIHYPRAGFPSICCEGREFGEDHAGEYRELNTSLILVSRPLCTRLVAPAEPHTHVLDRCLHR